MELSWMTLAWMSIGFMAALCLWALFFDGKKSRAAGEAAGAAQPQMASESAGEVLPAAR